MTTIDEVRHIAALARLGVASDRLPALAAELSSILDHMAMLQRIDTAGVAAPDGETAAPLRADSGPPIPLSRPLVDIAPAMREDFFLVPRLPTHDVPDAPDAPDAPE
jgi:aspartyl-tRNA(Asn)/glutamyl-tRNA(Gln) amidotransferase subunit C